MALVYFHPGALVRLCVPSAGSPVAAALWDGADTVVTSRLADIEVRAVLAGALHIGKLDDVGHDRARARWGKLWLGLWTVTDAVHLASALVLESLDLSVLSWDDAFSAAARAEGLHVLP